MDTINWLLIHAGDAFLSLWNGLSGMVVDALTTLDGVLNPVLAPVLTQLNPISTALGDAVYAPLDMLPAWLGLVVLSTAMGIAMLVAFRYTSNQDAIGRARDDIKANLLALKLFKENPRVMIGSQLRLLWAIIRLQRYVLTPVLVMLVPMLLALAQMGVRYQWRPIEPGAHALLSLSVKDQATSVADVSLEPNPGLTIEVGPVPGDGRFVWRVRGAVAGRHTLRFHVAGDTVEKEFIVGSAGERVGCVRTAANWTTQLLHPTEPPLPSDSPASAITVGYPGVDCWFTGSDYWVVSMFAISMIAALLLKPVFRVRF